MLTQGDQRAVVEVLRQRSSGQHDDIQNIAGNANQGDDDHVRNGDLHQNVLNVT